MCFDEGVLQAYIDGELDEVSKNQIKDHLNTCKKCNEMYKELLEINGFVNSKISDIKIPQMPDKELMLKEVKSKRRKGVLNMVRKYKKIAVAAAAVLLIASSIWLPPVQKVEAQILSLFRVTQFKAVTLTPDDIQQIQSKFYDKGIQNIDLEQYGKVKTSGNGSKSYDNIEQLKADYKYIKTPSVVPDGFKLENIFTDLNQKIEITPNVKNLNNLIRLFGGKVLLPSNLEGKTFTINAKGNVNMFYINKDKGNGKEGLNISIVKTPDINVPEGVDINKVREAIVNLPFLPEQVQKQIAAINDWKHTLPIPVDGKNSKTTDISINGNPGILIQSNNNKYSYNSIIWIDNGVIYSLSSSLSSDQLIKIAQSFK